MATKNQPAKKVRLGRIKAVIWKNPGSNGNGPLFNTTLARLYPVQPRWTDCLLWDWAEMRGTSC